MENRLRWVIEVKSPAGPIGDEERDQAWSYATHPEIKALFYLVTNGRSFELFRSIEGPKTPPVLKFEYAELAGKFVTLRNVLAPESLKRDFQSFVLDTGAPLGPRLRSFAKVVNGTLTVTRCTPPIPGANLVGMIMHLREGSVERAGERIVATLKMESSQQQVNEQIRDLGLETFEIASADRELSADSAKPNVFTSPLSWVIPRGSLTYSPIHGRSIPSPIDIAIDSVTKAQGVLQGLRYTGVVEIAYDMKAGPTRLRFNVAGTFEMFLS